MAINRVLMTGAAGYIAAQLLPTFSKRYEMVLIDVNDRDRGGNAVKGVNIADLTDPDRTGYQGYFAGLDAVVHLGYKSRSADPLDAFYDENDNVRMAYNVLRCAFDAGVPRVVMASSNHAADWYEHALIHRRQMEVLDPYRLPLSDNFYGWAKATYEHMGFVFACGFPTFPGFQGSTNPDLHLAGGDASDGLGVVMVRIGAPRELDVDRYGGDPTGYKRDLGAYISPRDLTQLFQRSIEAENIDNEHGVPWQVVYGISNNTRAFWSLSNARRVLGYRPEDDSEVRFARDIQVLLSGEGAMGGAGRVGL